MNTDKLQQYLFSSRSCVLVTHLHPDGDALGSTSALWHCLTSMYGKSAVLLTAEPVPDNLSFITSGVRIEHDPGVLRGCDLVILLDLNNLGRTGDLEQSLRECSAPKVLIDHHLNPAAGEFDLVFSRTDISSASELLYWILRDITEDIGEIPAEALRALMCGMTTDTNNFANSVFPSTLQMASELLAAGVDRESILTSLYRSHRENRVRAFAYFLSQKLVIKGGLAYIVITSGELERFDIREGELEGLVNVPLEVDAVKISLTAKEDGRMWRISIRSKRGWSANALAVNHFNGGGHEMASGGRMEIAGEIATPEKMAQYIEKNAVKYSL